MSLIGPGSPGSSSLIHALMRLYPRAKYSGSQLLHLLPRSMGPFQGGPSTAGAGQRFGQFHDPAKPNPVSGILGNVLGIGGQLGQYIQQQNDPINQLYQQLLGSLTSPTEQPHAPDQSELMRQVQAALNPIYDQRERKAKSQEAHGQQEIKGMYQALANDYKQLAPQQEAAAQQAQNDVSQIYGELRSNIEGSYGRVAQDQADLFQQLGIQSATPEVLDKQQAAVTDATTAASENQAQQQQRYEDIGNMDAQYFREGSPIAIMSGNEYGRNLLDQLTQYLDQNESERASSIQSGFMDQLNQANGNYMQQQQMANSQEQQRQQMLWQILQQQMQASQQSQKLTPDSYLSQLGPDQQQEVGSLFNQLQRTPEAIYGKVEDPRSPVPGTFVNTTPQWYMNQVDQMLQNGQIDPQTHQELMMYLQLYFGGANGGS